MNSPNMNEIECQVNVIKNLIDNKEYTEALFEIDECLKMKEIPMSISYMLNHQAGLICLQNINDFDMSLSYLMKTYTNYQQIEGLLEIVSYYQRNNRTMLAYSLSVVCLFTNIIPDISCNEFIYDYMRYYIHSMICLDFGKYGEAIENIKKCIEYLQPEMKEYFELMESCKLIFEKSNDLLSNKNKAK